MPKNKTLKILISFILLLSFAFTNANLSASILNNSLMKMISKTHSTDSVYAKTSFQHETPVVILQHPSINYQILYTEIRTSFKLIGCGYGYILQSLIYILTSLLYNLYNFKYLHKINNFVTSIKGRLSVIALSMGGNSPPYNHV